MSKRGYPFNLHYLHGTDVLASEKRATSGESSVEPGSTQVEPGSTSGRTDQAANEVLGFAPSAAEGPATVAPASALQPFRTDDGAALPAAPASPAAQARVLPSELPGVSDDKWTEFAKQMRSSTQPGHVSASNGLGMWDMRPRRLADLGLVRNLANMRGPAGGKNGRMVWTGEWVDEIPEAFKGDVDPPMTSEKFLSNSRLQYRAFAESMRRYVAGLRDGSIPRPEGGVPGGISLSGVLAILHRAGPSGLKSWGDPEQRFQATKELFSRVNGLF